MVRIILLLVVPSLLSACSTSGGERATIRMINGRPQSTRYVSPSAYTHYLKAQVAIHRGELKTAIVELESALIHDPESPFLHTQLALVLLNTGNMKGAMVSLNQALTLSPEFPLALVNKGAILEHQKRLAEAETIYRFCTRRNPRYAMAYLALATMLEESGKSDAAYKVLQQLIHHIPTSTEGYRSLAILCLRQVDYRCAARNFSRALRRQTDLNILHQLAHVRRSMGYLNRAVTLLREAFDRSNGNLQIASSLLEVLDQLGEEQAITDLIGILETAAADNYNQAVQVAALCLMVKRPKRALSIINSRLKQKDQPILRLARIEALFETGQQATALAELQNEQGGPMGIQATLLYSRLLRRQKQYTRATALLQQGLTQHGFNTDMTLALSQSLHDEGKAEKAVQVIRKALVGRPEAKHLRFGLAAALERAGHWRQAIAEMQAIVKKYPNYAAAHNFVGYIQAEHNVSLHSAEKSIRRALYLTPGEGYIIDSLGWLYYRRKHPARARKMLQMAVRLSPREAEILAHLAEVNASLKQTVKAILLYKKAISVSEDEQLTIKLRHRLKALERRRVGKR